MTVSSSNIRVMPSSGARPGSRIPVFASVPTKLDTRQRVSKDYVDQVLQRHGLEPRTVGVSDRGFYNPLHEVRTLARHCAGGIILGYRQLSATRVSRRVWTDRDGRQQVSDKVFREYHAPTPWNHLETGILFGLDLPLFVLRERSIDGGIFDEGASDVFIHEMPMPAPDWTTGLSLEESNPGGCEAFEEAVLRWQALVRGHYYGDC
jgi:hypothetical protein